eukprot:CAMPEP_0115606324 /NCGR_PEP_ID=MMETSP0272-20121206/17922_1 /TAXON_ID=71861 /ORGANISM="Scrippsiella trochoidea, Strain CCMP3099" /LENGTH=54 /DNA_ID=CAMNT_0003041949 /DNA_START=58 /DNA_END=222 /DNA_ORIENTATION=-
MSRRYLPVKRCFSSDWMKSARRSRRSDIRGSALHLATKLSDSTSRTRQALRNSR